MIPSDAIHPTDRLSRRERVLRCLGHRDLDRVPVLEQLSYNGAVIADLTGRSISGFAYGLDEICAAIRVSCDVAMLPMAPRGTARVTSEDGFVTQDDEWTSWHVSRPFSDEAGASAWLESRIAALRGKPIDPAAERSAWRRELEDFAGRLGGAVLMPFSCTGFCHVYDRMGLELFAYVMAERSELLAEFLELSTAREEARIAAVADPQLCPLVLIPEDFATKNGPLFSPAFCRRFHYPFIKRLASAWRQRGTHVLYHSDGNYRSAIPELAATGVEGFYCLEPNCGMEVVALKAEHPGLTWAGSVDGTDLMERGSAEAVYAEAVRQIRGTRALETGGFLLASSSEINPPIPAANFRALLRAAQHERRP